MNLERFYQLSEIGELGDCPLIPQFPDEEDRRLPERDLRFRRVEDSHLYVLAGSPTTGPNIASIEDILSIFIESSISIS